MIPIPLKSDKKCMLTRVAAEQPLWIVCKKLLLSIVLIAMFIPLISIVLMAMFIPILGKQKKKKS